MLDIDVNILNPNQEEVEPDLEIIKFGYASIEKGIYTTSLGKLMGMLKYILNHNVKDYKEEYYLLYKIYQKINIR